LRRRHIPIRDANWLDYLPPIDGRQVQAQIRSTHSPVSAQLGVGEGGVKAVELLSAQEAVAPGQACVIYDGERVLGGGWISRAID